MTYWIETAKAVGLMALYMTAIAGTFMTLYLLV